MKKLFTSLLSGILLVVLTTSVQAVNAASLLFDPSSASIPVGQTSEIKVNIDATGEQVRATDIYILYDSSQLEITSVSNGSFFPNVQSNTSIAGKVTIGAGDPSPGSFKSGTGTIATLMVKGKGSGTSTMRFDCTDGSTSETNIYKNDTNATDIIECSKNNTATVTVGGTSTTSTTTTTTTSGSGSSGSGSSSTGTTAQITPTELPKTGIMDTINQLVVPGILLLLVGSAVKVIFLRKY